MIDKLGLLVLIALFVPTLPTAAADQMTLSDLRSMCAPFDADGKTACRFYILGAFEGLRMAGSMEPTAKKVYSERSEKKQFCVPDNIPQSAMVARVIKLADADVKAFPADANMPAISFIGSVISTSYPCR